MSSQLVIGRTSALLLGIMVLVAGLAVGAGAFRGGMIIGERTAPDQVLQTELAEKTYTVKDLEAALVACEINGVTVQDSSVTLLGADYPGMN